MSDRIEPIKKSRLSDEVLKRLQSMIIDGTFSEGEQLPTEKELSEQFQVSRASVREALRILETLGFLGAGPGGGFFVQKISIEGLLNPFSKILGSERDVIIEMLEFRRLLETEIARLAAEHRTEEDLDLIQKSIDEMRRDITFGGIGLKGDNDFHDAVAAASGNSVFEKMLSMAKNILVKTRETTLDIKGQPQKSLLDHMEIYNAIENGDAELAEELMFNHLLKAYNNTLNVR